LVTIGQVSYIQELALAQAAAQTNMLMTSFADQEEVL
jgi:hypothetical protein